MTDPVSWQRPSPRLLAVRGSQIGVLTLGVLIVVATVAALSGGLVPAVVAVAVVLALGAAALLFARRRVHAWGYAERDEDLLVRRGLLFRRLSVVPYGRMQFVDVNAGPFERLFGLATVRLHTAAAASDARIPGLAAADAERLRDALAARGESRAMGL